MSSRDPITLRAHTNPRVRRLGAAIGALVLGAAAVLVPATAALGAEPSDMVLDWNQYAAEALSNPPTATPPGAGRPPTIASLYMAMVHAAVYDAVNSIDRGRQPYLVGIARVSRHASKAAAAATAAHHVLVSSTPTLAPAVLSSLDALYAASLMEIRDGSRKTAGIRVGAVAAAAMLAERADDGRFVPYAFTPGSLAGQWRPELPAFMSDPFAWLSNVRPFTLKSTSQFRTRGPLDLESAKYAREFDEVKRLGSAGVTSRSAEQTALAQFYTANPLPMFNAGFRAIADRKGLSLAQDARLFAMLNVAAADVLINCWDDKDHWNFWRPITAIRHAADDGNPATVADPEWLPFFPTPPYPDHPSGYNCFSGAMMHTAKAFFGTDKVTLRLTSPATMTTRTYRRFTSVLKDTIDARIYLGFHFRTPDVQGAELGKDVAKWVAKHFFRRAH